MDLDKDQVSRRQRTEALKNKQNMEVITTVELDGNHLMMRCVDEKQPEPRTGESGLVTFSQKVGVMGGMEGRKKGGRSAAAQMPMLLDMQMPGFKQVRWSINSRANHVPATYNDPHSAAGVRSISVATRPRTGTRTQRLKGSKALGAF
jgi:hypothetical protein